jgi:colanic acid/amylovoran biosynthesis glycosyltransferase
VNKSKAKICIILPCPPGYSETFLNAHVEKLSAAVNYLDRLPVDVDDQFLNQQFYDKAHELRQTLRAYWHGCLLNPLKKISLRKFFETNKTNVVLAEYGLTGIRALRVCSELKMPLIVHFHGYDAYSSEVIDRYKETYKKMFAYSRALISVSRHMTEQLIRLGAPREKVFYNPYGVDVTKFNQAAPLTSSMQVLAVGRFVEKKAPYLTLLAFKEVLRRLPTARLVMVGNGPLFDVCRKIVDSLHMEYAVDLKGVVNHDQIATLMRQSRVFVQHSLVPASADSEGTPNTILEASATALPVVSTRHGGIADVVIHGRTGFLVDEGDVDGMSEYIWQLLSNAELAAEMGQKGREYISKNFNLEASIKSLRHIIEEHSS